MLEINVVGYTVKSDFKYHSDTQQNIKSRKTFKNLCGFPKNSKKETNLHAMIVWYILSIVALTYVLVFQVAA